MIVAAMLIDDEVDWGKEKGSIGTNAGQGKGRLPDLSGSVCLGSISLFGNLRSIYSIDLLKTSNVAIYFLFPPFLISYTGVILVNFKKGPKSTSCSGATWWQKWSQKEMFT